MKSWILLSQTQIRLASDHKRGGPPGEGQGAARGDLARIYSVCTRSNHFSLRPAHTSPLRRCFGRRLENVGGSDISASVWSASRCLRGRRFNRQWPSRRSSGSTLANSNPSPWVVRLPRSITCFHLSRHITGLQRHRGTAGLPWEWVFSLRNSPDPVFVKSHR